MAACGARPVPEAASASAQGLDGVPSSLDGLDLLQVCEHRLV